MTPLLILVLALEAAEAVATAFLFSVVVKIVGFVLHQIKAPSIGGSPAVRLSA